MRCIPSLLLSLLVACQPQGEDPVDSVVLDTAAQDVDAEAVGDDEDAEDASAEGGALPLAVSYDVGVIPDTTCPGSTEVTITMDDEDDSNNNDSDGWIGGTESGDNTTFHFCRVSGTSFKPLTTSADSTKYYAVLMLGTSCPNGSLKGYRYFDNEDDSNNNSSTGTISPSSTADSYTKMYFCMFMTGSSSSATMSSFPTLTSGFKYGVFGTSSFSKAVDSGWVYTDDEDDSNNNAYSASGFSTAAQQIISSGSNTKLKMARVK